MAGQGEVDSGLLIKFAQRLAGNEKKWRDYALKKLRKWFQTRASGGLSREEMLKIWKGLHYCMWMSDKPLVQEELADSLSKLMHCFKQQQQSLLFLDVFLQTQAREWFGIDRLRLDKFMMLIRRCVNQGFIVVKNSGWSKKSIKSLNELYAKGLMNGQDSEIPDGLRYHMADIYLDELEKVGSNELDEKQVLQFLEPYSKMLGEMKNQTLFKYVVKNVFEVLFNWGIEKLAQPDENEDEDNEDSSSSDAESDIQRLPLNLTGLADQLFEVASGKNCLGRNRKPIYDLVTRYRDLAKGVIPEDDVASSDSGDMEDEIEKAARNLLSFENKLVKKKEKGGKKRKHEDPEISSPKEEKKKKKGKDENKSPKKSPEKSSVPVASDEPAKKKKRKSLGDAEADSLAPVNGTATKAEKKARRKSLPATLEVTKVEEETSAKKKKIAAKAEEENDVVSPVVKKLKRKSMDTSTPNKPVSGGLFDSVEWEEAPTTPDVIVKKTKKRTSLGNVSSSLAVRDKSEDDGDKKTKKNRRKSLPAKLDAELDDSVVAKKAKKSKKQKSGDEIDLEANGIQDDPRNVSATPEKAKKNKKGKVETPEPEVITSSGKRKKKQSVSPVMEENKIDAKKKKDLFADDDGDVEVWIPNKKYSGPLKEQFAAEAKKSEDSFAAFDKLVKTPPAFVKKAVSKATPKSSQKKKLSSKLPATPNTEGKRRVSFALNKNMAQDFEDSLTLSPAPPFHPNNKPETSILKPSPMNSPALVSKISKLNTKRRRSKASDFF